MSDAKATASASAFGGLGLSGCLTLLFVVLKLVGEQFPTPVADWSWWLVFSPLLVAWGLFLAIMTLVALIAVAIAIYEKR